MLESILVGILLTVATVGIHATGTAWWIGRLVRSYEAKPRKLDRLSTIWALCATAVVLLLLHVAEVTVWASAYLAIPNDQLNTVEEAVYFSTVTFTSLGYGDVVIENSWRLLSGIQAMVGLLVFGWSTALLFAVVRRIWV